MRVKPLCSLALNSIVVMAFAMIAFTAVPALSAQAQEGGTQYKIAVVDMGVLMSEYEKRKEKYDELQREVDRLQEEIDAMSERIERAKETYDAQRATMTDDERFDRRAQIESEFAQYRSELERRQRLIDTQEERVLKEVVNDIELTIAQVAEAEGYHLILNASKGPRAGVLYHSATIEITSRVLQQLNQ